ncbi:MAG TPA: shikimate kinase [Jatrophihabitantaceae bacterium]|jgi:adenylate kinase family enzyme
MRRVSMVGASGSGKSTLGRALADRLGVPFVELDSIFHQPGWTPLPPEVFAERVASEVGGDGWVIDGNYSAVRPIIWSRADTVVWADPPRHVVMRRLLARTVRRGVTRQELWNGNRESLRNLFSRDPDVNVVLWAWRKHPEYRASYAEALADPANAHLRFIRIMTPADASALLASATRPR